MAKFESYSQVRLSREPCISQKPFLNEPPTKVAHSVAAAKLGPAGWHFILTSVFCTFWVALSVPYMRVPLSRWQSLRVTRKSVSAENRASAKSHIKMTPHKGAHSVAAAKLGPAGQHFISTSVCCTFWVALSVPDVKVPFSSWQSLRVTRKSVSAENRASAKSHF